MDNKQIYKATLCFSIRRALWDILALVVLGGLCYGGFLIADKATDKGLIGLLIGGVIGLIAIVIFMRWVSYKYKAGQIAMMTKGVTEGTLPEDVIAAIGPSICQDCYEVSEDVIDEFRKVYAPEEQKEIFYRKENGKYQLDLWKANRILLENSGIRSENLSISELCTCCNHNLLFSHRASQGKRGNLAAFLGIR